MKKTMLVFTPLLLLFTTSCVSITQPGGIGYEEILIPPAEIKKSDTSPLKVNSFLAVKGAYIPWGSQHYSEDAENQDYEVMAQASFCQNASAIVKLGDIGYVGSLGYSISGNLGYVTLNQLNPLPDSYKEKFEYDVFPFYGNSFQLTPSLFIYFLKPEIRIGLRSSSVLSYEKGDYRKLPSTEINLTEFDNNNLGEAMLSLTQSFKLHFSVSETGLEVESGFAYSEYNQLNRIMDFISKKKYRKSPFFAALLYHSIDKATVYLRVTNIHSTSGLSLGVLYKL